MRCARPGADEYDFRACACEIIRRRGMRRARRCRCDDGDIDHWRGRDKAGRLYIGGGGISLLLEIAQAESRELAVAASAECTSVAHAETSGLPDMVHDGRPGGWNHPRRPCDEAGIGRTERGECEGDRSRQAD